MDQSASPLRCSCPRMARSSLAWGVVGCCLTQVPSRMGWISQTWTRTSFAPVKAVFSLLEVDEGLTLTQCIETPPRTPVDLVSTTPTGVIGTSNATFVIWLADSEDCLFGANSCAILNRCGDPARLETSASSDGIYCGPSNMKKSFTVGRKWPAPIGRIQYAQAVVK